MRLPVYIGLVAAAAGLLVVQSLAALQTWPSPEELARLAVLLLLTFGAAHLRFQLRTGWMTSATTVPHIAAALLLPPGLAAIIGLLTRISTPRPFVLRRFIFNTANTTLAVVAAAHVAGLVVPHRRLDDWTGLAAALLASLVYHFLQVPLVATAVALDSGKPIRGMALEVVSPEQLTEIGLGLVGGALALMVSLAPVWAAGLILPGLVVFRGKQAMDRAQRRSRDLALTSGVGRAVAGVLRPELAFKAIAAPEVRDVLKLDGLAFMPLGSEAPAFTEHVATAVDQPAVRAALAQQVAQQGRRVQVHGNGRGLSAVALPFGIGERTPVGALVAWRGSEATRRHPFTTEELLVLETLADYAAVALETARLAGKMAELSREAAQAEAQRQAEALQQEALRQSEERFRSLVQNASDVIAILDADATIGYVSPAALQVWGYDPEELRGAQALSLVHPDDLEPARDHLAQVLGQPGQDVSIELRLRHADGSWRDFDMLATNLLDQPAVAGIVATYRDITQRKAFERELSRLAFRDALTDLPNRALFLDRLERALARADRSMRRVAVLFLDLDNFKVINDSLGHDMGDALLVEVAERLRRCLRTEDTAARLGGDEFTVLLEDLTTDAEPEQVAERIAATLREPVQLGGRDVFVTASIGLALSRPRVDRPDSLLRNADLAMYRAKAGGKACWEIFEPSMETRALERLELETDLRHALARGEFRVHYQPVVELTTGRVAELEALVRWERPGHGLVAPLAFIPVAEDTGFIVSIGQWVLEQACQQARAWQERYPGESALVMCVNLSARQFQHPTLVDDIQRTIASAGIDPRTLKLEITESVIMQDGETAVAKLQALKELGVQLAIDDFGTGYSSLSYLKRFPVDTLKVDRSFVDGLGQDAQDTAIVRSVIALAKTLNMSVTGEGVETPPQQAHLRDLGCDLGQGYLFARPLPAEELEALLDDELPGERELPRAA